jgi:hypothetical protein
VDKDYSEEYWFDHRIHTLGNSGFFGALHAAVAPFSTMIIDAVAYGGEDVRKKVRRLRSSVLWSPLSNCPRHTAFT